MSFSVDVKTDLYKVQVSTQCCIMAELMALVLAVGAKAEEKENSISFITENVVVAKRLFHLIRQCFGAPLKVSVRKSRKLKEHNVYLLEISEKSIQSNKSDFESIQKIIRTNVFSNKGLTSKACCKKAFLRGIFLSAGSITNPNNDYHVELVLKSIKLAEEIIEMILKFDINARIMKRKNNIVVYIKDVENILDFLSLIGAHRAMLDLENVRILKEMRNSVNRIVNCETANLSKIVDASIKHIDAINFLEKENYLHKLPESLQDIAYLRIQYPDSSLKELGSMLNTTLGKSGVNHRLNKIVKIAEEIKEKRSYLE